MNTLVWRIAQFSFSASLRTLLGAYLITLSSSLSASAQSNTDTWICNAASEPLYITVRHNGASLLSANSQTEGWIRLPTRGVQRSCWIRNRRLKDQIVVVGVRRGDEIVPIQMTPRGVPRSRPHSVCVKRQATSFQYSGNTRSDTSCPQGFLLARASFIVLDGRGRVDLDLSGPISVGMTPQQREQADNAQRRQAEAARKRREQQEQRAAIEAQREAHRRRHYDLDDYELVMAMQKHLEERDPEANVEMQSTLKAWKEWLPGKVARLEHNEEITWVAFRQSAVLVAQTEKNAAPPKVLETFLSAGFSELNEDEVASMFGTFVDEGPSWGPIIPGPIIGELTDLPGMHGRSPALNKEAKILITLWEMFPIMEIGGNGDLVGEAVPAACLLGTMSESADKISGICFQTLFYKSKQAPGWSVTLTNGTDPHFFQLDSPFRVWNNSIFEP